MALGEWLEELTEITPSLDSTSRKLLGLVHIYREKLKEFSEIDGDLRWLDEAEQKAKEIVTS